MISIPPDTSGTKAQARVNALSSRRRFTGGMPMSLKSCSRSILRSLKFPCLAPRHMNDTPYSFSRLSHSCHSWSEFILKSGPVTSEISSKMSWGISSTCRHKRLDYTSRNDKTQNTLFASSASCKTGWATLSDGGAGAGAGAAGWRQGSCITSVRIISQTVRPNTLSSCGESLWVSARVHSFLPADVGPSSQHACGCDFSRDSKTWVGCIKKIVFFESWRHKNCLSQSISINHDLVVRFKKITHGGRAKVFILGQVRRTGCRTRYRTCSRTCRTWCRTG